MPPHCDSMDGPVVTAARQALDAHRVELVLPFVSTQHEAEIAEAFEQTSAVRDQSEDVRRVADRWFFETVVRLHRAGEGAPYTGLKPAGLEVGPVIPVAERAVATGSPDELVNLFHETMSEQVKRRLDAVTRLRPPADSSVSRQREYVSAMLSFEVWAHKLHLAAVRSSDEHR